MKRMAKLTSKIDGVSLWTYDIARRPDKTVDNGQPILGSYASLNSQQDVISPTTQNPTEYLTQAVNKVNLIYDVNHCGYGNKLSSHGIKLTPGDNIDLQFKTTDYVSIINYNNVMFFGDDIYIQAPAGTVITGDDRKTPFTTNTPGIKILDQTGIVHSNRGYSAVVFQVQEGYKIPVGNTIKATPTVQSQFNDSMEAGTPETYQITTEIIPGIYKMTLTEDKETWLKCDIDFVTVQTTKPTPEPTTPEPTTTTPTTEPIPTTTKPTTPTVTTQLDTLKNSLKIPLDLTDDDALLNGYLNSAKSYILNACDSDADETSIVIDPRFQIAQIEIATLMYENRGADKVAKGFPYTLQVLINQLRFV